MAESIRIISKITSHVRSNSFPTKSLNSSGVIDIVLVKFSTLENECSSSSASSISQKLRDIQSLYQGIENSIQLPSNQQALSLEHHQVVVEEVLEGSMYLLDVCAFINDVLSSIKKATFELESCLRRKNGCKEDISAYLMSRKKIKKMVSKYLKNLHTLNYVRKDINIDVVRMLKEAEIPSLSTLKCVLGYFSKPKCKRSGWSLMAKMKNSKHEDDDDEEDVNELEKIDHILHGLESKKMSIDVKMAQELSKQLASQELAIFEFEGCLESISRCLLKTRVSLLNILSHY